MFERSRFASTKLSTSWRGAGASGRSSSARTNAREGRPRRWLAAIMAAEAATPPRPHWAQRGSSLRACRRSGEVFAMIRGPSSPLRFAALPAVAHTRCGRKRNAHHSTNAYQYHDSYVPLNLRSSTCTATTCPLTARGTGRFRRGASLIASWPVVQSVGAFRCPHCHRHCHRFRPIEAKRGWGPPSSPRATPPNQAPPPHPRGSI